jgi:IclR family acetate operon transcriptional repressor
VSKLAESEGVEGAVLSSGYVQSVARAMELLKTVAFTGSAGASVVTLAQRCSLNRATAWRLLTTLEGQGMVRRDPATGWFVLGPAVDDLYAQRAEQRDLVGLSQPLLERLSLETGEIACLGVVDGDRVDYAAEVIPAIVDDCSWLGEPVILHASSIGKAFLASIDPERVPDVVGTLPRYTDATITSLGDLRTELRQIKATGYAVCRGEFEHGSWGVAAPVIGTTSRQVQAVVCLWGPDRRGDDARLVALGQLARRAARDLARL